MFFIFIIKLATLESFSPPVVWQGGIIICCSSALDFGLCI